LRDEEKGKSRNSATWIGMSKGLDQPDQKGRKILRITHPIPLILQEIAEVQQLRRHGDMFERLVGGFYKAHGRADDTMNLGGIKV
jgi:acyl-coenzyme A synthetase/AMP-(fatty) acid ligase